MSSSLFVLSSDFLECPICFENMVGKDPRVLSCQHTFCFNCLKEYSIRISRRKISCPECKSEQVIPNSNVNNLKKSIMLSRIKKLDSYDKETCLNHGKDASLLCLSHDVGNLCTDCICKDHKECDILILKKRNELLKSYWLKEDKKRENLLEEIENKEKEIMEKVVSKFKSLREKVHETTTFRKVKIQGICQQNKTDNQKILEINKLNDELEDLWNDDDFDFSAGNIKESIKESSVEELIQYFDKIEKLTCERWNIQQKVFRFASHVKIEYTDSNIFIYKLTDIDLKKFFLALSFVENVKRIHMQGIRMTNSEFKSICDSLTIISKDIIEFSIERCDLSKEHCDYLSKFLSNCYSLQCFSINLNKDFDKSFCKICKGLDRSKDSLKSLSFNGCNLSNDEMKEIVFLLNSCYFIERFEMAFSHPSEQAFREVCLALSQSSHVLEYLNFRSCQLVYNHRIHLDELLRECSCVKFIDISRNKQVSDCLFGFCNSLKNSADTLEVLNMSDCNLDNDNGRLIGNLLKECPVLKELNLSGNPYLKNGLIFILKNFIPYNLKRLVIDSLRLYPNQWERIENNLEDCESLEEFLMICRNGEGKNEFLNFLNVVQRESTRFKDIHFVDWFKFEMNELGYERFNTIVNF